MVEEKEKLEMTDKIVAAGAAEPCLVCGTPTAILHFQLNTCRACAAFYRRSLDKYTSYRCQKGIGKCDVTVKLIGKVRCQYCRYQKCIKVGMKIENKKAENCENTEETSSSNDGEEEKLPLISSTADFAKLFETTVKIFEEPKSYSFKPNKIINNSGVASFSKLLQIHIENRKPKKALVHYSKIDLNAYNEVQQEDFIKIAEFLNLYEPFRILDVNDKYLLFKKFWEIFSGLEKFYLSCLHFGNNPNDLRVALWTYYIDYDEIIRDSEEIIPGEPDKAFMIPMLHKARRMFKLFKSLNITLFELAYMSQIALWCCYDILELSKTTQKIAEKMLEEASNEMHEFFVNELRIPYYATRQAQLFKIVQNIEINVKTRKQMFLAKDIFNFGSNATQEDDFFNRYYKHIKNGYVYNKIKTNNRNKKFLNEHLF